MCTTDRNTPTAEPPLVCLVLGALSAENQQCGWQLLLQVARLVHIAP